VWCDGGDLAARPVLCRQIADRTCRSQQALKAEGASRSPCGPMEPMAYGYDLVISRYNKTYSHEIALRGIACGYM
jgi:hypothetical protein